MASLTRIEHWKAELVAMEVLAVMVAVVVSGVRGHSWIACTDYLEENGMPPSSISNLLCVSDRWEMEYCVA